MRPPAGLRSRRGLLLVEAVLAALVIAAGLVFVTRGLASPLRALRSLEEREALLALAHSRLLELEGMGVHGIALPPAAADFTVVASPREQPTDAEGRPTTYDVTLTVSGAGAVSLMTVWPSEWVPSEWTQ